MKAICLQNIDVTDTLQKFIYTAFWQGTEYREATVKEKNQSPGPGPEASAKIALINSRNEVHYMTEGFFATFFKKI